MDYYVSKKAGSILLRKPNRLHLVAGDHIPTVYWDALGAAAQQSLMAEGAVEGFTDPDSVQLAEAPPIEQPIRIGVSDREFMAEAKVQRGVRHDRALSELEQLDREREQSMVDMEAGGSPDGVIKVELPPEDLDEGDEDLTDEERDEIRRMEQED